MTYDIEIYIRRPNADRENEEYVWAATYRDMAQMTSRTVIQAASWGELDKGQWEIGIRECGDEQYSQRFELTPLLSDHAEHEIQNRVAAILNHWRQ